MSRHQFKEPPVKLDRLTCAPEFLKDDTGIVDRVGIILSKLDGVTISRQRFFPFRLLLQHGAAIVKCLGVVRFQLDGIFKGRQCLVEKSLVLQDGSQIIVGDGKPGIE